MSIKKNCDYCKKEIEGKPISVPKYIKYFCSYECVDKFLEEKGIELMPKKDKK